MGIKEVWASPIHGAQTARSSSSYAGRRISTMDVLHVWNGYADVGAHTKDAASFCEALSTLHWPQWQKNNLQRVADPSSERAERGSRWPRKGTGSNTKVPTHHRRRTSTLDRKQLAKTFSPLISRIGQKHNHWLRQLIRARKARRGHMLHESELHGQNSLY